MTVRVHNANSELLEGTCPFSESERKRTSIRGRCDNVGTLFDY